MTDLDKLEALAKAATQGPWATCVRMGGDAIVDAPTRPVARVDYRPDMDARDRDAAFIAAANPAAILDLIASARRDAEEIERLRAGLEEVVCWFGEAPHTFPDWKVTAEALADMAQNVLDGHPALSSPASRVAHTGEG